MVNYYTKILVMDAEIIKMENSLRARFRHIPNLPPNTIQFCCSQGNVFSVGNVTGQLRLPNHRRKCVFFWG